MVGQEKDSAQGRGARKALEEETLMLGTERCRPLGGWRGEGGGQQRESNMSHRALCWVGGAARAVSSGSGDLGTERGCI